MKKNALVLAALAGVMALSLTACSQPDAGESSPAPTDGNADAVTTASVTTGLYGNMSQQELLDAIAAYSGVSVVSTVNADGTPNIAIFTPGAAGDDSPHRLRLCRQRHQDQPAPGQGGQDGVRHPQHRRRDQGGAPPGRCGQAGAGEGPGTSWPT